MLTTLFSLVLALNTVIASKIECSSTTDCTEWDYKQNTQTYWENPSNCPNTKCASSNVQQSPININNEKLSSCSSSANLQMTDLKDHDTFEIENDAGHFNILVNPASSAPFGKLNNGIDGKTFCLANIHFHWKSEHTIDGDHSALEVHFVHYNCQYSGIGAAVLSGAHDALAVVAVLFEEGDEENAFLKKIADKIDEIVDTCKTTEIEGSLQELLPNSLNPFYQYYGSLTTPKCNPVVEWHVLQCKMTVSEDTLDAFKKIKGGYGETYHKNYRDVQERKHSVHLCGRNSGQCGGDEDDEDDDDDDEESVLFDFNYNTVLLLVVSIFIVLTLVNTMVIICKHFAKNKNYERVPVIQKDIVL